MVDATDQLVIQNLKRAGDLIREAVQMTLPKTATPEDAVNEVVAFMVRAVIPRAAALEFNRLGGSNADKFRRALLSALHEPR